MRQKKGLILLLVVSFLVITLGANNYQDMEILSVAKTKEHVEKLIEIGVDFLMERNNRVYFLCSASDLFRLHEKDIPYVIETPHFYPYGQNNVSLQGGVNGDYHSYLELEKDLTALEESYPGLARIFILGESLEKRNIYALKISDNVSLDEDEAEVAFLGCHHAREWISVEVPYLIGKYLLENYRNDATIRKLVNESEIWIVPLINPDGLEYSIHVFRYWRKNRRDNGYGSYGVDLNRNYGYNWGLDDMGSSPNPFSNVYRGTSAFSEPETQAVRSLFIQKNIQAVISYHSFSQVILYPWGFTEEPAPADAQLEMMAAEMSRLMEAVRGNVYEYGRAGESLYLTNGDTTDWTYGVFGIPSFTIELPPVDEYHGGFFNAEEEIGLIFKENLPAVLYLLDWSIKNYNPGLERTRRQIKSQNSKLKTEFSKW